VSRLGYHYETFEESGVSGATTSRPVLGDLLRRVRRREYQAVAVARLDRLGRSLLHLLQLLQEFEDNGVRLLIHDQALDTGTPQGRLFFAVAGAFSEYERFLIVERVKDGLAHAKRAGTRSGRPIGRPRLDRQVQTICDAMRERLGRRGAIASVARDYGVSRAWLYSNILPLLGEGACVTKPPARNGSPGVGE